MTTKNPGKPGSSPSKKGGKEVVATPQEIHEAFSNLSDEQVGKLTTYARLMVKGLASKSPDKGGEDLFQESVLRLLDGRRKWVPAEVTFEHKLYGIIDSIVSEWKTRINRRPEGKRAKPPGMDPENENDAPAWIDEIASEEASAEGQIIAMEDRSGTENPALRELKEYFTGDEEVLLLLDGIMDGMSKEELRNLGWETELKFEAAHRRLRNRLRKLSSERE